MAPLNLTDRELEILIAYVKLCKGEVRWEDVAAEANCNTPKYARDKFALIRNKLLGAGNANTAADGAEANYDGANGVKARPASKGRKKATPRKRGSDSDYEEIKTPKTAALKGKKGKISKGEDVPVKEEPNEAGALMDDILY